MACDYISSRKTFKIVLKVKSLNLPISIKPPKYLSNQFYNRVLSLWDVSGSALQAVLGKKRLDEAFTQLEEIRQGRSIEKKEAVIEPAGKAGKGPYLACVTSMGRGRKS